MSRQTIERLYSAFAKLDADAMTACYAEDACFDDEAFSLRGRTQIGGMWVMLCDAVKAKGRDVWKLEVSRVTERSAHWEPTYRFPATGRTVTSRASFMVGALLTVRVISRSALLSVNE